MARKVKQKTVHNTKTGLDKQQHKNKQTRPGNNTSAMTTSRRCKQDGNCLIVTATAESRRTVNTGHRENDHFEVKQRVDGFKTHKTE